MSTASWAVVFVATLAGTPVALRTQSGGKKPILVQEFVDEQDRIHATLETHGSNRKDSASAPASPPGRFPAVYSDDVTGCLAGSKWQIDSDGKLSNGEYGVVYKASDGQQEAVVKVMRLKPDGWMGMLRGAAMELKNFAGEIAGQKLAAEMDLSVPIHDYFACGKPGGNPTLGFIFMGKVQGMTLEHYLMRHTTPNKTTDVSCTPNHIGTKAGRGQSGFITNEMYQTLLKAIPPLDKKGLITSDLHTANIMVDTSGPREKMVFIDFGLAYKYEHKDHQAVRFALGKKFGCPLPQLFKDVKGFEAKYTEEVEDDEFDEFDEESDLEATEEELQTELS